MTRVVKQDETVGIYEFAKRTGYSYKHVYEQVRMGLIPAHKVSGVWLIPKQVLDTAVRELGSNHDAG